MLGLEEGSGKEKGMCIQKWDVIIDRALRPREKASVR